MRSSWTAAFTALALLGAVAAWAQESDDPVADANNTIVVPGEIERPVPTPPGDTRTTAQRMQDIAAWDRCVTRAQASADTNPTRYQAESPEEYCRSRLNMQSRLAEPVRD